MARKIVTIGEVRAMLEVCAKGHQWEETDHYYVVTFGGGTYPTLPKGPHGSRGKRSSNAEIESGHVRKMSRALGFMKCAKQSLDI